MAALNADQDLDTCTIVPQNTPRLMKYMTEVFGIIQNPRHGRGEKNRR